MIVKKYWLKHKPIYRGSSMKNIYRYTGYFFLGFIPLYIHREKEFIKMAKVKKLALFTVMSLSILLCSCTKYEFKETVQGTVVRKDYSPSYTTMISVYNGTSTTFVPQHHSEKYNVKIVYKNNETTVDNRLLYESVNEGDSIDVNLYVSEDGEHEKIRYEK